MSEIYLVMEIMLVLMTKNSKYGTTIKLLGIVTAALLLIPIVAQTQSQMATAQADQQNNPVLQKISRAHETATEKIASKDPNLPVFFSGVNPDERAPQLVIGIDEKALEPLTVYKERLKTILGDIPMTVGFGHFEYDACPSQTSQCDPVIGGIKIQRDGETTSYSTLTLPATKTNGIKGFIMSGHVSCFTGLKVWQPTTTTRAIGEIYDNPWNSRLSDSAFIRKYTAITTADQVFNSPTPFNIFGKQTSSNTPVGTTVMMQGVASGLKTGSIQLKPVSIVAPCGSGTVTGQVAANYSSQTGDSGAPIISTHQGNNNSKVLRFPS